MRLFTTVLPTPKFEFSTVVEKVRVPELPARVEKLVEKEKELLKQIEKLKTSGAGISLDSLLASAVEVKGIKLLAAADKMHMRIIEAGKD